MTENIPDDQIEIIQDFVQECLELTDKLEPGIMELGKELAAGEFTLDDENQETINAIFRLFHSMKGGAGFLDLENIGATAHAAENLLDEIRKSRMQLQIEHIDLFCSACDFTRAALDNVSKKLNDHDMAGEAKKLAAALKIAINESDNSQDTVSKDKGENKKSGNAPEANPENNPVEEVAKIELGITPEMLQQFTEVASGQLPKIKKGLTKWKKNLSDQDTVSEVFRLIRELNENCGDIDCTDMATLSRMMLDVLAAARASHDFGKNNPADSLQKVLGVIKRAVADLSRGGKGTIRKLQYHLGTLESMLPSGATNAPPLENSPDDAPPRVGEILVSKNAVSKETLDKALAIQNRPIGEVLVGMGEISEENVQEALQEQDSVQQKKGGSASSSPKPQKTMERQDIRVDLSRLDNLIDLIGEMVIAENMLIHNPDLEGLELDNFQKSAQQMSKLVREVQEVAMAIRMIPVTGLFRRMTRLVHDLSRKSGKKVDFQLAGTETELDKTVIETITDPLVHLIRNSMDHGLEPPEERKSNGKKETGVLKLSAFHEEGEVWITLADDGRGLNKEKILAKAIDKGIISGDETELNEKEVANLIFMPGFSTAEVVNDVSGRGVGMDVVRQNLAQINGKIDVESKAGNGTRIHLKIPLTMAIIEGMLIRVGSAQYILPILPIRESLRPLPEMITTSPDGNEMVMIRHHLYPVLRLHNMHNIEPDSRELHDGILLLLDSQENPFCLFVDEILGQQQTVMKGLSEYIGRQREIRAVSGCTILANGEVCLILDIGGLSANNTHSQQANLR